MSKSTILVALILIVAGCSEPGSSGSGTAQVPVVSPVTEPVLTAVGYQAGDTATLKVPEMMCPFACYPNVKDILEEIPGVEAVELVPQKEEGKIDDRRVTVTFDGEVDSAVAIAALEKEDFPGSQFE